MAACLSRKLNILTYSAQVWFLQFKEKEGGDWHLLSP
jgi:hypothetical protein